ncbi:hypothetical protein ACE34P_003248 [Vibrio fluvialis]
MDKQDEKNKGDKSSIHISAPWGGSNIMQSVSRVSRDNPVDPNHFVSERTRVHEAYIIEQEKTKRLSLILSAVLLLAACLIFIFAPEGREQVSTWIGVALVITAAGAAGYKRVWGKSKIISFGADNGRNN